MVEHGSDSFTVFDPVSGDAITTGREARHVVIFTAGVPTIYLSPGSALRLARRLMDSVTTSETLSILGDDLGEE